MTTKPDHGEESYVGHGRLEGKVALVTGGDSGIGRAIALAYAREGANTLLGRPAQPAELAPIYAFLASPEASYVVGEIFGVTGGRMHI